MRKLFLITAMLIASFSMISAQTIKSISLKVDTIHKPAQCPAVVKFTATIISTGTGTLPFRWERSDGGVDNSHSSVTLSGTGRDVVTTTWTLGRSYVGWQRFQALSPDRSRIIALSNYANFSLICQGDKGAGKGPRNTRARDDNSDRHGQN